jgi:hypothetical protein
VPIIMVVLCLLSSLLLFPSSGVVLFCFYMGQHHCTLLSLSLATLRWDLYWLTKVAVCLMSAPLTPRASSPLSRCVVARRTRCLQ